MKELKGACIIGQSGGPTSVINASAYGVIDTALKNPSITQCSGRRARHQGRAERPSVRYGTGRPRRSWSC